MIVGTPQEEERAARQALQRAAKMQRGRETASQREFREKLARVLAETSKLSCRCGLRSTMTKSDIRALGGGCTSPTFICPRLDAVRRRVL